VAQEEEALMMLRTMVQSNSCPTPAATSNGGGEATVGGWIRGPFTSLAIAEQKRRLPVHLHEEKVFVQLRAEEEHDSKIWIYDTRATNHMSGSQAVFTDLDMTMCGMVRFDNDSVARIEGCGSVLFICKNGEHFVFASIYYIPRFTTNIVSVGQLDETGYDIHIKEGTMSVREPSGRLLERVERGKNRLYQLTVNIA
jgi:hypothetical protein